MDQDEFNATFKLPFKEASEFFKGKLSIPAATYDDIWKDQHARAFMSAGALKSELVADLRGAVQKSIDGGMNLKEFRGQFDDIVMRHGWSYNGGRAWRSELIWDTNITTAYQAGRWQQFEGSGAEYLAYIHADGVQNPRPLHVSWHGITLPIGDPWIQTHFPPNGWKCHCRMGRADRAEWARAKAEGKGTSPKDGSYQWVNKRTGEVHQVPNGIDPGWDYNVGAATSRNYRVLSDKFETLPNDISRAWMKEHVAGPAFERFVQGKIEGSFPVAVVTESAKQELKMESQTIWLDREVLAAQEGLTLEDYRLIPEIVDAGLELKRGRNRYLLTLDKNRITALARSKA